MARKLRIYLDTSVVSAYFDDRDPSRQALTVAFWEKITLFEAYVCPVMEREIKQTVDDQRKKDMLQLVETLSVLSWEDEMEELARSYVDAAVFGGSMLDDARHVAACVVSNIPILLSWNFRHLVNRRRRNQVNLLNLEKGYQEIEIIAPPELT